MLAKNQFKIILRKLLTINIPPRREAVHGRHQGRRQIHGLRRNRVRPPPVPARNQLPQRPPPRWSRARRHQRTHARHGGGLDQAGHGGRAKGAGRPQAGHPNDHAGARRTGV